MIEEVKKMSRALSTLRKVDFSEVSNKSKTRSISQKKDTSIIKSTTPKSYKKDASIIRSTTPRINKNRSATIVVAKK